MGTNSDKTTKYPFEANNMHKYLHEKMPGDIANYCSGAMLKTGYENIDCITNLYPGLYVIGAITSLGKTTFIHQMGDQIAKAGNPVLFFSLEQSTLELASKSIARIMAIQNRDHALTSLQVRKCKDMSVIADAISEYDEYAENMHIVECNFQATITDIENYVIGFMKQFNKKPVVVVDYLQVIRAENTNMSSKDIVDTNVRRLKKLQSDNKLVLIVISSLNRANYLTTIDYESFKETGGIEYSADVVWGLQLEVLHDEVFDKANKLNEKRRLVKEAKAAPVRKIELICLKNRFGVSSYSCFFDYLPHHDLFIPNMSCLDEKLLSSNADRDGFSRLPDGMKAPFS